MATSSTNPTSPVVSPPGSPSTGQATDGKLVGYEEYIDTQIERTRRTVKIVDIAATLLTLTIVALAYLLTAALVEHWLVPGGFGVATRTLLALALFGILGYHLAGRLGPAVVHRINPAYAAQTIERSSPTLKNSLLNLLLFRRHREEMSPAVYQALEEQAAQRLARVPIESAVDRTQLIRLGYVLLAVLVVGSLYKVLSPKDPMVTAGRVLMPWSDLAAPSRVTIENVEPGAITVARGDRVTVSAEISGWREDDAVLVRYTTEDGQAVNRAVPMSPHTAGGRRFECELPEPSAYESLGLLQSVRYHIEAGDARSRDFEVNVVAAPAIFVERLHFDFPEYTEYIDRTVDELGDIRAIEGTRVTVEGRANSPIQEAFIDFEADGRRDIRMSVDDTTARATFTLALRSDRLTPEHTGYALRFENKQGHANRRPPQYEIDVIPDLSPEIEVLEPTEPIRDVRLNETVVIEVEARDPDFALSQVRLQGEASGKRVLDEPLLESRHVGRFVGQFRFTPSRHGLRVGDVVHYTAVANDNRTPEANSAVTPQQTFRIVSPEPNQPRDRDQFAQRDPENANPEDNRQSGAGDNAQPEDGQAGGGERGQPRDSGQDESGERDQGQREPGAEDSQADRQDSPDAGPQSGAPGGGSPDTARDTQQGDQPGERQPGGTSEPNAEPGASNNLGEGEPGTPGDRAKGQPGTGSEQSSQPPDEDKAPVSPSGDNDGEAFERIRRHFESQRPDGADRNSDKGDGQPTGQRAEDRQANRDEVGEDSQNRDGQPGQDQAEVEDRSTTDARRDATGGERAQPRPQDNSSEAPNGQRTTTDGSSGAEEQPDKNQAVPEPGDQGKADDTWQQRPTGQDALDSQEPPSTGRDRQKSDTQGEQGGDRTGGGQEGAGQEAPHDGTGSSGQNQSADEGAGQSSERGAGDLSPDAGSDKTSSEPTGQAGESPQADGRAERDGAGEQPGGQQGSSDATTDQQQRTKDGNQDTGQPGGPGTNAGGGGQPGADAEPGTSQESEPGGDPANLEYARKQTDLVLEKLADQLRREEVDRELLEKLGWTEDDLRRFIERWQRRKELAKGDDEQARAAQRELDDSLRSLGLRPRSLAGKTEITEDELRDLRQGTRGPVPLKYQDRVRAYNQGVSRNQNGD